MFTFAVGVYVFENIYKCSKVLIIIRDSIIENDLNAFYTTLCSVSFALFGTYILQYSGGQATEGQGGYYGSGGARKSASDPGFDQWQRPDMLALAADVTKITTLMNEVETLEHLLQTELSKTKGEVTNRSIEISTTIKKICTQPEVMECLNRLEMNGEPVWGLSSDEREMIMGARKKVNEC